MHAQWNIWQWYHQFSLLTSTRKLHNYFSYLWVQVNYVLIVKSIPWTIQGIAEWCGQWANKYRSDCWKKSNFWLFMQKGCKNVGPQSLHWTEIEPHKSIFPWKISGGLTKKQKKKSPHRSKLWTCAGVHLNACTVDYLASNTIKFSIPFLITFTLNIYKMWRFFLHLIKDKAFYTQRRTNNLLTHLHSSIVGSKPL